MSKDTIYRQDAIDALDCINGTEEVLRSLPSAQPERLTDDDFETIRIHLNAYKESLCNQRRWKEAEEYQRLIDRFMSFASAQSDAPDINVGDIISRRAAVTENAKLMLEYGGENEKRERDALHRAANGIKALPSAQPEQRWISSGKKPLKEGSYLVWMPFAPPKHRMAVAEYCGGYWNIKTPISAWMSLPEPYEEGQDE